MRRALFSITLLALSSVAASDQPHGGIWKDVKVANMAVYATGGPAGKGYVVATFSANGSGTQGCASGYPRDLVIDLSTPGGAFAASVLQAARLTGSSVTAHGTGTCSVIATTETLTSVQAE